MSFPGDTMPDYESIRRNIGHDNSWQQAYKEGALFCCICIKSFVYVAAVYLLIHVD